MLPQINVYAAILIISAAFSAALAIPAWRRRPTPGAATLTVLMLALALWAGAYALEILSATLDAKLFCARLQYVAILAVPTLWLIFVLQFTGHERWLTRGRLAALAAVPGLTLLLIWIPSGQSWLYRSATIEASGPAALLAVTYGPLFWVQAAYSYIVVLFATALVFVAFLRGGALQRAQNGTVLVGALVPLVGNAVYISGISPLRNVDLTPVLFIVTGLASVWALARHRLLDLLPVVRDALVESMTDGVAVVDAHGRLIDLNKAAQTMIGQRINAVLGAPATTILPAWPELVRELSAGAAARTQISLGDANASVYYDVRVSPLNSNGSASRGWLVIFRDETARVRAEQAERQQRMLVEGLRNALEALTSTLSIDEVIDRILELTAAVVPHEMSNFMLIEDGQAHVRRTRGYRDSALNTRVAQLSLDVMATPNLRRMCLFHQPLAVEDTTQDSEWIFVPGLEYLRSYAGAPIIVKGQVIGFLSLDSTQPRSFNQAHAQALQAFANQAGIAIENARLYASLQETNTKLSRALQAREEAIQNVSHEFRTPLTLMLGYVEFIESGEIGPVTAEQANALRIVAQQGRRLQFIFTSLLTLQTFQRKELRLVPTEVGPWLEASVRAWRHLATDAGITIVLDIADQLPIIMAAPGYLDLLIGNLLDNAVKFSRSEQQICVSAWADGEDVMLSVADQGAGILSEQLELIFDRFYQVDSTSTRRYGGMGIGLALCKAIVEAHIGRIWAESPGLQQGSTFYVLLPGVSPEKDAAGTSQPGESV
jgi:PAS domain S-box-containing protein